MANDNLGEDLGTLQMSSPPARGIDKAENSVTGPPGRLAITRNDITVGRAAENTIVINNPHISGRHLRFYVTIFDDATDFDPLVYCEDRGSTNGTWINGRCIENGKSVLLLDGDIVGISGDVCFRFTASQIRKPAPLDEQSKQDQDRLRWPYRLTDRVLGSGGFGKVYLAVDRNGDQVACKVVDMEAPPTTTVTRSEGGGVPSWERALREVDILMTVSHPNVIDIKDYYKNDKRSRLYIFEELITHGDLFSFMNARDNRALDEKETKPIVWQLLKALQYLHDKKIVHRDLKPENILCASREVTGRIVLVDFGAARVLNDPSRMLTVIGTKQFVAPEVLSSHSHYTTAVDMWSLGVIVHNFLFCDDGEDLSGSISKGDLSHLEACETVGRTAKDFVKKLLCINPQHRLTAAQAMKHPWLTICEGVLEDLYQKAVKGLSGVSLDRRSGPSDFESAEFGPSNYLQVLHPSRRRKREASTGDQEGRIRKVKIREVGPEHGGNQDSGGMALKIPHPYPGLRKRLGLGYFRSLYS